VPRIAEMRLLLVCLIGASILASASAFDDYLPQAKKLSTWLTAVRREFHEDPELMYQEHNTSARIRRYLTEMGVAFEYGERAVQCS
jgi:IAA-amino acid hydrolase